MLKFFPAAKNIFLRLCSWNIVLYAVTFLALWPFSNYPAAIDEARSVALSRAIPDFTYLSNFRDGRVALDKTRLREYSDYFRKVDAYIPEKADILALRGYCAFYLGHNTESLQLYQRAVAAHPYFFSCHYNLGALYFKKGDYAAAIKSLSTAFTTDFTQNLLMISSSRMYFPLLRTLLKVDQELTNYLRLGYERCSRLLILSHAALNNPAGELKYALQAINQPTQDPSFFVFHAGIASAKMGFPSQAINFLTKYLSQNPQDAEALYFLGTSLQSLGQENLAAGILAQAEELKSKGASAPHKEEIVLQIY